MDARRSFVRNRAESFENDSSSSVQDEDESSVGPDLVES